MSERLAAGLQIDGVKPGDVVCILAPNHIDYHVVFYAVALINATLQAVNPMFTKGTSIFWYSFGYRDLIWFVIICKVRFSKSTKESSCFTFISVFISRYKCSKYVTEDHRGNLQERKHFLLWRSNARKSYMYMEVT